MSKKVKLNFSYGYFKKDSIIVLETSVANTLIKDGKATEVKEKKAKNKMMKNPPIDKKIN